MVVPVREATEGLEHREARQRLIFVITKIPLLQRKVDSQPRKKEPSVIFFRPHYRDNG
jgi:hypothetical protein